MKNYQSMIKSYMTNSLLYLKNMYPDMEEAELVQMIKEIISDRREDLNPELTVVLHDTPGNSRIEKLSLSEFMHFCEGKIIAPSGTVYQPSKVKTSFITKFIQRNLQKRKAAKAKMFEAKMQGDKTLANYHNNEQALIKILNNALIGIMRSPFTGLYDKAGFNSVTSFARKSIYVAYSHVERFLASNFFLPDYDRVINHLVLVKKHYKKTPDTEEFSFLYRPSREEVIKFVQSLYLKYNSLNKRRTIQLELIEKFLSDWTEDELLFLFYCDNLKQLLWSNKDWFERRIRSLLVEPETILQSNFSKDLSLLRLADPDLIIVLSTSFYRRLQGKNILSLEKTDPELALLMTFYLQKFEEVLRELDKVIFHFANVDMEIPDLQSQKKMLREVVATSDTDSILYTKKDYVKWFTGSLKLSDEGIQIGSLIDYWVNKSLEHQLETLCRHQGVEEDKVKLISMKNESTYTALIISNLAKHYLAEVLVMEGNVLPKPELVIKGVQYRGSVMSGETLSAFNNTANLLIRDIADRGKISASDYLLRLLSREKMIQESLFKGELTYLPSASIKYESEYKDPSKTIFFGYQLWQNVFSQKYGDINVPTKTIVVKIDPKKFRSEEYYQHLLTIDDEIAYKLREFLSKIPKTKAITQLPINSLLEETPIELRWVLDSRSLIHSNCKPWYILYESLGMTTLKIDKTPLFLDTYPYV